MPTRRIRSRGGGGGDGGSTPIVEAGDTDVLWDDTIEVLDALSLSAVLEDTLSTEDALAATIALQDTLGAEDAYSATLNATLDDSVGMGESSLDPHATLQDSVRASASLQAVAANISDTLGAGDALTAASVGLSDSVASSDTFELTIDNLEPTDDAWIHQSNPDTNHGNDDILEVQAPTTLGNGERRAFILWDFTGVTGVESKFSGQNVTFFSADVNAVVNRDLLIRVSQHDTKPFDEGTVTWNNPPPAGTTIFAEVVRTVTPGGGFQRFSIFFNNSDINESGNGFLGKWLMLEFTNDNTVDRPDFEIASKEHATVTKPLVETLELELEDN